MRRVRKSPGFGVLKPPGSDQPKSPTLLGIELTEATFGLPIPLIYGRFKVPINLIWDGNFNTYVYEGEESLGDVEGFGGARPDFEKTLYWVSFYGAIGEGGADGLQLLNVYRNNEFAQWRDGAFWHKTVYKSGLLSQEAVVATEQEFKEQQQFIDKLYPEGQHNPEEIDDPILFLIDAPLAKQLGSLRLPKLSLRYPGVAYLARLTQSLGTSASFPQMSVEVTGLLPEPRAVDIDDGLTRGANPSAIVKDALTNPIYGAGFPSRSLGNMVPYYNYCAGAGFYLSPVIDEKTATSALLEDLMEGTNCDAYVSQGRLQFAPRGDEIEVSQEETERTYVPRYLGDDGKTVEGLYLITKDDLVVDRGNEAGLQLTVSSDTEIVSGIEVNYTKRNVFISPGAFRYRLDPLRAEFPKPNRTKIHGGEQEFSRFIVGMILNITDSFDFDNDGVGDLDTPFMTVLEIDEEKFRWIVVDKFISRFFATFTINILAPVYEEEITDTQNEALTDQLGFSNVSEIDAPAITDAATAKKLATITTMRAALKRTEYTFKLDWRFGLLDPTDIVILHYPEKKIINVPVQIEEIEEDDDGILEIKARDLALGVNVIPLYNTSSRRLDPIGSDLVAGGNYPPVIFEPPGTVTGGAMELWIAVAPTGSFWGSSQIWLSKDGGVTYEFAGDITHSVTLAHTTSELPVGGVTKNFSSGAVRTLDETNTLQVQLVEQLVQDQLELKNVGEADAIRYSNLLYVSGGTSDFPYELMSYVVAKLTDAYKFDLSRLYRAAFSTPNQVHPIGSVVAVLNNTSWLKIPIEDALIGTHLKIKILNTNTFGVSGTDLDRIDPITYRVQGWALLLAFPKVPFLTVAPAPRAGEFLLTWGEIEDPRNLQYEIRKGDTWQNSEKIAVTGGLSQTVLGDGRYWVSGRFKRPPVAGTTLDPNGAVAYLYGVPTSLDIEDSGTVTKNVVLTFDEFDSLAVISEKIKLDAPVIYLRMGQTDPHRGSVHGAWDDATGVPGAQCLGNITYRVQSPFLYDPLTVMTFDGSTAHLKYQSAPAWGVQWSVALAFKTLSAAKQYFIGWDDGAYSGTFIGIEGGNVFWQDTDADVKLESVSRNWADGFWHLLLVSMTDDGFVCFHIDGAYDGYRESTTKTNIYGDMFVGQKGDGTGFFNGSIGKIATYDFPFSPAVGYESVFWSYAQSWGNRDLPVFQNRQKTRGLLTLLQLSEADGLIVADVSGNKNDTTFVGKANIPFVAPVAQSEPDGAIQFDGISDQMTVPNHPSFDPIYHKAAIEFCFIPDQITGMAVVALEDTFTVFVRNQEVEVQIDEIGGARTNVTSGTKNKLQIGKKYHVYVDIRSTTGQISLYINGELEGLGYPGHTINLKSGKDFVVGKAFAGILPFKGKLDEVAFYIQPLSVATESLKKQLTRRAEAMECGTKLENLSLTSDNTLKVDPNHKGIFTPPLTHRIIMGRVQPVRFDARWKIRTFSPTKVRDVLGVNDLALLDSTGTKQGLALGVEAYPEIRISQYIDMESWSAWDRFSPGVLTGRRFDIRFVLESTQAGTYAELSKFKWLADVEDDIQTGFDKPINDPDDVLKIRTIIIGSGDSDGPDFIPRPYTAAPSILLSIIDRNLGDEVYLNQVLPETTGEYAKFSYVVRDVNDDPIFATVSWITVGY